MALLIHLVVQGMYLLFGSTPIGMQSLVIVSIQIWQRCMAGLLYSDAAWGLDNGGLAGLL